jgi:hypothetical protein
MKKVFSLTLFFIAHNVFAIVGIAGGSCSPVGGALAGFSSVRSVEDFAVGGENLLYSTEKMGDYKVRGACPDTEERVNAEFQRCTDGTVSYEQPDSTGINGYNGYCGETSASNVLYMQCRVFSNPETYSNRFTQDITPGTRPANLKKGLNNMFDNWDDNCPEGRWQSYNGADSPEQYINYLIGGLQEEHGTIQRKRSDGTRVRRAPFPVMIQVPPKGGKGLHWVTVVDVEGWEGSGTQVENQENCNAVINHWGDQYKVPCHRLASWAKDTGNGVIGAAVGSYPRVKFVPATSAR